MSSSAVHPGQTVSSRTYPVHIDAVLDRPLSRWLWLVKGVLVVPHYLVLAVLWAAFMLTSMVAFVAILVTGSYPRGLFEFKIGVLRWTWRVAYYAYGALGTDRYPPFILADVPDYPARLDVAYPDHLSRGLVLVKWWLLAIPHYLVIGFFVGGGAWLASRTERWQWSWGSGGLITVLVMVAAVVLAVTGRYPRSLFDLILGMHRWVFRVVGYAALMTDVYPPLRLDLGGQDPGHVVSLSAAPSAASAAPQTIPPVNEAAGRPTHWSAGRIVALVVGALFALTAIGPLVGGAATIWADRTQRDATGMLTSPAIALSTDTRAVASESLDVRLHGPDWTQLRSIIGDTRLRFAASSPDRPIFVGVAPADDVAAYLSGTQYVTVTDLFDGDVTTVRHDGDAPSGPPAAQSFWVAKANGTGAQSLTWTPQDGDWAIVVMNADGSPGVSVSADAGATAPVLGWVAVGLLIGGAVLLLAGVALLVGAMVRPRGVRESTQLPAEELSWPRSGSSWVASRDYCWAAPQPRRMPSAGTGGASRRRGCWWTSTVADCTCWSRARIEAGRR
jgi:hypothetical protein